MALPPSLKGTSSAFDAAQALVDLATEQANKASDERNEKEIDDLSLAYGTGATGRGMASGPAALATKDAANKVALDAKNTAIAKANATYGTFIESIGYGVPIP